MSLVTCPNCKEKVDVDSDICPECGYKLFDFEINTHEDTFHDDYSDYVGTTKSTKPVYKLLSFISIFAFIGGMILGLYQVLWSEPPRQEDAGSEAYFLVYFGIGLFIIIQILSSIDRSASYKETS
jgi:hypothetical protein